jgi:hypothetical protein
VKEGKVNIHDFVHIQHVGTTVPGKMVKRKNVAKAAAKAAIAAAEAASTMTLSF